MAPPRRPFTHTSATLGLPPVLFNLIKKRFEAVDYQHAFSADGTQIDMHGVAIQLQTDRLPESKYGIICDNCGPQGMTEEQYDKQMARPSQLWRCPSCGEAPAWFDDERLERWLRPDITPASAVTSFAAWLTTRTQGMMVGANYDAAKMAELVGVWLDYHKLPPPPENFQNSFAGAPDPEAP